MDNRDVYLSQVASSVDELKRNLNKLIMSNPIIIDEDIIRIVDNFKEKLIVKKNIMILLPSQVQNRSNTSNERKRTYSNSSSEIFTFDEDNQNKNRAVLSDVQIKEEIQRGNIIFKNGLESQIQNSSINISLGDNFYRNSGKAKYLNPLNNNNILDYWDKLDYVKKFEEFSKEEQELIKNEKSLLKDKKFLIILPGETILGHSMEFVGGRNHITTMIKARSSMGRCNITICRDAGWGDIGYINRWTLEITNNSLVPIILPYQMQMAQIVFFYTGETRKSYKGKYQNSDNIEEIIKNWHPSWMLPSNI